MLRGDPVRPGRAAELRRVRQPVAGRLRRLARDDHADRLAVVSRLRRVAAVRRARGRPLRHPAHADGQHAAGRRRPDAQRAGPEPGTAGRHLRRRRVAGVRRGVGRGRLGGCHLLVHAAARAGLRAGRGGLRRRTAAARPAGARAGVARGLARHAGRLRRAPGDRRRAGAVALAARPPTSACCRSAGRFPRRSRPTTTPTRRRRPSAWASCCARAASGAWASRSSCAGSRPPGSSTPT